MNGRGSSWVVPALTIGCLMAAAIFFARDRWFMAAGWAGLSLVGLAMRLPRGRRAWFALAAIVLSVAGTMASVFGLDLYLHHRFARGGGYNVWGYRGPAVGAKRPDERRLVMLGGSVAFGFGVAPDQTIPYFLEQRLNDPAGAHPISVVNLGWNSEGAYSFKFTLRDYEYLDYDGAVLYSGYNDLLDDNTVVFRHQSAVFRLTGYLPILPIVPIRQWLYLDDLSQETRNGHVVFRHGLADRYTAEATDMALRIARALERQLGRLTPPEASAAERAPDCDAFGHYCQSVEVAAAYALSRGKQVFVVTEPYKSDQHMRQQAALAAMLRTRFAHEPRVHYVDMGRAVDLNDPSLSYDGLHLTAAGNARVADRLAPALRRVIGS